MPSIELRLLANLFGANREFQPDTQPATLPAIQADISPMLPYARPGHREAEADAASIGVTGSVNPVEWLKYPFALAPRNPRALIFDQDDDMVRCSG